MRLYKVKFKNLSAKEKQEAINFANTNGHLVNEHVTESNFENYFEAYRSALGEMWAKYKREFMLIAA